MKCKTIIQHFKKRGQQQRLNMDPFTAYKNYLGLRLHFTQQKYNYVTYRGGVRSATIASFNKRKDRFMFYKLAKHRAPINLMIANMIETPNIWVGQLFDSESEKRLIDFEKRIQSLAYTFKQQLQLINVPIKQAIDCKQHQHCLLLQLLMSNTIHIETVVIIDILTNCFKQWDIDLKDDSLWQSNRLRLIKYRSFLTINVEKYNQIVTQYEGSLQ